MLDTDSLVSVVLPTRNRSRLLPRAVHSVLTQSHSRLELIIVDDNSDDDTPEVVQSFGDERIEYIRHEVTRGPGWSRNAGVAASQGQFVAFLDDDDEFLPGKLEVQMDAFSKSVGGVGVVLGHVDIKRNGRSLLLPYDGEEGSIFLHLLAGNMFPLNASLLRRQVLMPFDEKLTCLEDFDFHLKVLQQTKVVYVEKPCAVYHADSNRKRLFEDRINLHRTFRLLRSRWFNDPQDMFLKEAHADLVFNFALRLLAFGHVDEVTRDYLNQAFAMKKDRRRIWYKLLNIIGPSALKIVATKGG